MSSYTGQTLAGQRAVWEPQCTAISGENAKCISGYRVGECALPFSHHLVWKVMTVGKASLAGGHSEAPSTGWGTVVSW